MKISAVLALVFLVVASLPSIAAAQEHYPLNVEYAGGSADPYVVMTDPGRYTITQAYSWVRDESSRYSLVSYSVDGGDYVDISRKARGDFTLDIEMGSPRTISFQAVIQYPISVGGSDLPVSFSPASPTHDNWFDLNTGVTVSLPYATAESPVTRERLVGWSLDRSAANVIASADNESDTFATQIMMSRPHTVDFGTKTQHYVNVISERGTATPSGWYDAGTAAAISIILPSEEFLVQHEFAGWDGGDVTESSSEGYYSGSIIVDSPKTLVARWTADYSQLVILVTGVAAATGITAALTLARKKKMKAKPIIVTDSAAAHERMQQIVSAERHGAEPQQSSAAVVELQQPDKNNGSSIYLNQIMEYTLQKSIEKLESFRTSGMISDAKFSRIKQELEQSFL